MSSKKVKVVEIEPRLVESIPLLRSAAKLYQDYTQLAAPPGVHDIQLSRFGDYLKHFGFALEKELPQSSSMVDTTMTKNMGTTTKRLLPPLFPSNGADELVSDAAFGIPDELRQEADTRSAEVDVAAMLSVENPPPGLVGELAKTIVQPFERVSRMQSPTQCAMKKARCLYMWLATNVVVTLELAPPITPSNAARGGANAKGKKNASKPPKEKKKKGSTGKDGRKNGTSPAAVEEEAEPLPDPLVTALSTRLATPLIMANLYTQMLTSVGLSSRVVEGLLKGPSSEEALEWAWNVIEIDDRAYLVDIAYSSYTGPLRKPKPDAKGGDAAGGAAKSKGKGSAAAPPPKKDAKKESEPPSPRIPSGPGTVPPFMSLTKPPTLAHWRRSVEDFYFFTHPAQFIHTHLPYGEANTLLCEPPTRVAWDLAPRQTHSIYQFGISLSSHRRNQCFTVRSAPFYLTFKNENPANIQLCCALYKCSLWELPEDLQGTDMQLPPEYVWHQRRESDNTESFTVTVPEGGFYSAVIGARYIREDPYTSAISDLTFTPIVEYQMKVNFVPIATPTFPRQHLSPNLCRLMTPLSRNILAGPQPFAVMPTCSNIAAVAIVRYQPPSSRMETTTTSASAAAAAASSGLGNENDDLLNGSREILAFLPFSSDMVTYMAEVDLEPSTIVEVWVLYRAPDKNGFTFQEKVAIQEKERRVPTPPPSPPPQKSKKQVKKKLAPVDVVSPEELEMARLVDEVAAGRAFLPFVTGIQAKTLLTRETGGIIQPQPSIESERAAIMRRLAGITPQLYDVATDLQRHVFRPVGGYYPVRR